MPTEEEQQQPGTGDAQQQEQLEPPSTAASKESPATVPTPTSDATVENEQKSDTCKAERRSMEEESSPQTKSEPSSTKEVEEDRKTEQVVPVDSTSASEHVKKDEPQSDATKGDSSPTPQQQQQQQELSTSSSDEVPALVKGPPTPVPSRQDEDDDEEEEDDEGDNEDQEEQQQSSQPQRQQQRSSKQRSAGSRDGYNNEDNESQNQRQDQSQTPTGGQYYEDDEEDDEDEGEEPSELRQLFEPINDSQALSEDEEDGDYIPDEEVKKTIMVGSDFQAVIPEGLCRYDDALPYENEDKLLWNPTILNEQQIEDYLVKITAPGGGGGLGAGGGAGAPAGQQGSRAAAGAANEAQPNSVYALPLGNHLRDDEQSLYLLQQCGHNVDEALRRKRISNNAVPVPEQQMSIWSEEECRNFENGLRVHGKDFHMIQQTKVRTRSVGELVQFYYLWKKTERHDLFASKARLEKKKYNLHPGLTDHMDRFLEEQENSTGFGDRSSSPGFNSLYSSASEAKRQRLLDSKENNTASTKRSASNL